MCALGVGGSCQRDEGTLKVNSSQVYEADGAERGQGVLGHETLLSLYGHQGTEGRQCSGWGSRGAWRAGGQAGPARGISGERNKYIPEDSRARKRRVLRGRDEMPGVGVGQRGSLG